MPKKEKQISQFPYIYRCPVCGKRILDSNIIDDTSSTVVRTKCDHCNHIVDVVLIHENLLKIVDVKLNTVIHTEQRSHLY